MPRPRTHDEELRGRLLDRAAELLSAHGPGALSLRKLATDTDTSTTAVYSLFGGKPALLEALFAEAFRRFGEHLAAVPRTDDPLADILEFGMAYRRSALADPHLYTVMFGAGLADYEISQQARDASLTTFEPLLDAVRRGVRDGLLITQRPELIAYSCWAVAHGVVSLQIGHTVPESIGVDPASTELYADVLRRNLTGWLAAGSG